MTHLTPEQDRIISNGKALKAELRHEISTLHYKRDFLKIHRLETIIAALSLLDELAKGTETDGFEASDFADLHKSFIDANNDGAAKVTSALLSNNYNVILAALKRCSNQGAETDE